MCHCNLGQIHPRQKSYQMLPRYYVLWQGRLAPVRMKLGEQ